MMLRELEAFEACWLDLKHAHPTSGQDNMLIAHAMGQLVDRLEKPAQVERDLPYHLQELFRRLALAYFQGYSRSDGAGDAGSQPQAFPIFPAECPQHREISAAVDQVKALAKKAQRRVRETRGHHAPCSLSEMETLIVEFPEHWQPVA